MSEAVGAIRTMILACRGGDVTPHVIMRIVFAPSAFRTDGPFPDSSQQRLMRGGAVKLMIVLLCCAGMLGDVCPLSSAVRTLGATVLRHSRGGC